MSQNVYPQNSRLVKNIEVPNSNPLYESNAICRINKNKYSDIKHD
jgi:hypothetical protein